MQRILCIGLCGHLFVVLVPFAIELFLDFMLFLEALLQVLSCRILILHQLLLILIELQDMTVEHLDLVERGAFYFLQIPHKLVIVHLELAEVAHAKFLWVVPGKLAFLVAADDAN